jgi:L-ascorbate metabolism protein UlaG (beta-lactamase superfamily)
MNFQGIKLTWLGHSTFRIETTGVMLPVGDLFTMGPHEAGYAVSLLKPKTVIPMHFGTFPVLTGTPGALQKLVPGVQVLEVKPGVTIGG